MPGTNGKDRFRFSLAVAFGVITVSSISIAALRGGDWRWARVMFTVSLVLLLAAVLGAVYRAGVSRAFWIGFALFGWTYILLTFVPAFRIVEHLLIGKEVASYLKDYAPEASSGIVIDTGGSRIAVFSFAQIVNSILALVFAVAGGLTGAYFHRTRRTLQPEHSD